MIYTEQTSVFIALVSGSLGQGESTIELTSDVQVTYHCSFHVSAEKTVSKAAL